VSGEERKAVVRWALEVLWNAGTLEVVDEILAGDVVVHDRGATIEGADAVKEAVAAARAAHPGLELRVEEQVAEGDLVATRWTATDGDACATGLELARFEGARVAEVWESWHPLPPSDPR
jgi:predicted SnoaL-like aldol condensation-catalyzing enzyme